MQRTTRATLADALIICADLSSACLCSSPTPPLLHTSSAARECVPDIVDLMASVHGWDRSRKAAETKAANEFLDTMF
jgi:hypothetical protein